MKVRLRKDKRPALWQEWVDLVEWVACLPFVLNSRAILVHRVRYVRTFVQDGKRRHEAVTNWCGNSIASASLQFIDNPPESRLLCARCEAMAVAAGERPADELAGRHVHVGRVRAERMCCQPTN